MGHIFIAHGDITQIAASAIAYSTSGAFDGSGRLYTAFRDNVPGFTAGYKALRQLKERPSVGDAFWIPMVADPQLRGVVAVVTVGRGRSLPDKTTTSVRSAICTAVKHLRTKSGQARLLIALPTFHAGVGGGHRRLLEIARIQISAANSVLQEPEMADVDVAIVAYTRSLYHVYLHARQLELGRLGAEHAASPPPPLAAAIRNRECVFFFGAGMSSGAGLPSWSALVRRLSEDLDIASQPPGDLEYFLDLAQWHRENVRDPTKTVESIVARLFDTREQGRRPTLAHYLLLAQPFQHVITTNYDGLIEQTLRALRRHHHRVVRQEDVALTGRSDGPSVIKLHGDASSGQHVVLSRDDYETFFTRRPAMATLLEGLLLNRTFFFVGYSLRDPNFRQIYNRIADMLAEAKRPAYATTFEDITPYQIEQWQRKGLHLVPIPGHDIPDKARHLLLWLDRLAEVATRDPQTFLAPDADARPGPLDKLRAHLRDAALEAQRLCGRDLSPAQAALVAQIFTLLIDLGWRPPSNRLLSNLLTNLARSLGGDRPDARRRLLARALAHTVKLKDADEIWAKLEPHS